MITRCHRSQYSTFPRSFAWHSLAAWHLVECPYNFVDTRERFEKIWNNNKQHRSTNSSTLHKNEYFVCMVRLIQHLCTFSWWLGICWPEMSRSQIPRNEHYSHCYRLLFRRDKNSFRGKAFPNIKAPLSNTTMGNLASPLVWESLFETGTLEIYWVHSR